MLRRQIAVGALARVGDRIRLGPRHRRRMQAGHPLDGEPRRRAECSPRERIRSEGSVTLEQRVRVLIVGGVRLYREGLEVCVAGLGGTRVVGCAAGRDDALRLLATESPDVVLLDLTIPDALGLVRRASEARPSAAVLALAADDGECDVAACALAGVGGVLSRDASVADLSAAVRAVLRREFPCSPRAARQLVETLRAGGLAASSASTPTLDAPEGRLTGREAEIVLLIQDGMSNKEIARRLVISVSTVKNHVHSILAKLGVDGRYRLRGVRVG